MAIVQTNPLVSGLHGMLGGTIVFRTLRGKIVMANRPRRPSRQSEAQRANRDKFADAACFAQAMMKDAEKKAHYWRMAKKLGLPNGYTAAIKAYMRGETAGTEQRKAPAIHAGISKSHGQRTGRVAIERLKAGVNKQMKDEKVSTAEYSRWRRSWQFIFSAVVRWPRQAA